jgi:hypothetical protein
MKFRYSLFVFVLPPPPPPFRCISYVLWTVGKAKTVLWYCMHAVYHSCCVPLLGFDSEDTEMESWSDRWKQKNEQKGNEREGTHSIIEVVTLFFWFTVPKGHWMSFLNTQWIKLRASLVSGFQEMIPCFHLRKFCSQHSQPVTSVEKITTQKIIYCLDDRVSIPARRGICHYVQTGSGAHLSSYRAGTLFITPMLRRLARGTYFSH